MSANISNPMLYLSWYKELSEFSTGIMQSKYIKSMTVLMLVYLIQRKLFAGAALHNFVDKLVFVTTDRK